MSFLDKAFPVEVRHVEGGSDQIRARVDFDRERGHLDLVAFDDGDGHAQIAIYAGVGVNIALTFDIAHLREVADKAALVLAAYDAARVKAKVGAK